MSRDFKRTSITTWVVLSFKSTEDSHAELAIYNGLVFECMMPWSTNLNNVPQKTCTNTLLSDHFYVLCIILYV